MAMELKVSWREAGMADGDYSLQAPGCAVAILSWADEKGALEDWTSLTCLPLDVCGKGVFHFPGGRAIPPQATHIYVRAVTDDLLHCEEGLFPIAKVQRTEPMEGGICLCVMSDLHLSSKTALLQSAFAAVGDADALLLAGDMTNDGVEKQYELLKECLSAELFGRKVFPVIGNHDMPRVPPEQEDREEIRNYFRFQKWVFENHFGGSCEGKEGGPKSGLEAGPDGAYAFRMGVVEIIGLQAVADQRRFCFEDGRQIAWLEDHLALAQEVEWHLILCHAPLLHHNLKREPGRSNPYLDRDKQLQEIVDHCGRVIFIAGHTHLSVNNLQGCVEWDAVHGNLYVNDGSIRPTELFSTEAPQPAEWREGNLLEIRILGKEIELTARSISDGKKHSRGYYRIKAGE